MNFNVIVIALAFIIGVAVLLAQFENGALNPRWIWIENRPILYKRERR
jgi:hypothetical protein